MTAALPRSGSDREALREKGQFWTPPWVADAMVSYVIRTGASEFLDPAVGAGAFVTAAIRESERAGRSVALHGCELHSEVLDQAAAAGVPRRVLDAVRIADFVLDPPTRRFAAIAANPPYIRHHRIPASTKAALRELGRSVLGRPLDGRAGYHVYFLIRALRLLAPGGRLAFIMPADTCEGVFAPILWRWIAANYRLDGVVTFAPDATPFPGVDTNAVIFLIENSSPTSSLQWIVCQSPENDGLRDVLEDVPSASSVAGIEVIERSREEAVQTGLSRPLTPGLADDPKLGEYAAVLRGIATGANEFFHLTADRVRELAIPHEFLIRAVGRTRDVPGAEIVEDDLRSLEAVGRPTYLFSANEKDPERLPASVRAYVERGEAQGFHERALIRVRRPWYRAEHRDPPPLLFAYLGRRNARFIRNRAGVVPLTGFLCVYPHSTDPLHHEALWHVLSASATPDRLASVGKSYGGGAIKVEPRALERLPLDQGAIRQAGLPLPERQLAIAPA